MSTDTATVYVSLFVCFNCDCYYFYCERVINKLIRTEYSLWLGVSRTIYVSLSDGLGEDVSRVSGGPGWDTRDDARQRSNNAVRAGDGPSHVSATRSDTFRVIIMGFDGYNEVRSWISKLGAFHFGGRGTFTLRPRTKPDLSTRSAAGTVRTYASFLTAFDSNGRYRHGFSRSRTFWQQK